MTALLPDVVRAVAASFARTTPWCDPRDLHQEAALATLEVRLARWALLDATRKWGRVVNGATVAFGYVDLTDIPEQAHTPDLDAAIDAARALARIRAMLAELPAARAVLLEQWTPDEVAEEFGVPKSRVYRETHKARAAVRARLVELATQD